MAIPVQIVTAEGPGCQSFVLVSAATTNATNVQTGSTQLIGWAISNPSAAVKFICFHDTAVAPTAGQNIKMKYGIPASGASNQVWTVPIQFNSGLAITLVTNAALSDATAVAAGDLVVNLFFV